MSSAYFAQDYTIIRLWFVPFAAGEKRGALVETSYGSGRWVYVGLGLWRQLPAGVDGAYQLLANLISLKGS